MIDREEITNVRQSEASEGVDEAGWNSEAAERRVEKRRRRDRGVGKNSRAEDWSKKKKSESKDCSSAEKRREGKQLKR